MSYKRRWWRSDKPRGWGFCDQCQQVFDQPYGYRRFGMFFSRHWHHATDPRPPAPMRYP